MGKLGFFRLEVKLEEDIGRGSQEVITSKD
jgi:hypothetical protein